VFGLFNRFGRAQELRRLDDALRGCGLHPALVPEAVKLTLVRLLGGAHAATPEACATASALLCYCMLGAEAFADANGEAATAAVERRLALAVEAGDGPDARLVLLALHAGVVEPEVLDRFGFEAG